VGAVGAARAWPRRRWSGRGGVGGGRRRGVVIVVVFVVLVRDDVGYFSPGAVSRGTVSPSPLSADWFGGLGLGRRHDGGGMGCEVHVDQGQTNPFKNKRRGSKVREDTLRACPQASIELLLSSKNRLGVEKPC